jgi:AraC-like DNA-binding protein
VGYSKSTVLTQFKKEFHTTVNNYLNSIRLEHSKKMLENSDRTVSEIALDCGFSDQSYFSKMFSAKFGKTPTDYRRGH